MIGVLFPAEAGILFSFPLHLGRLWGPFSLISNGYRVLFPGEKKRPVREADYSLLSIAEVKNAWSYTSNLTQVLMAWCLDKQRDPFDLMAEHRS
jgi:hypothetical protein